MQELHTSEAEPKKGITRRDFLKVSAAIGAAAAINRVSLPNEEQVNSVYQLLSGVEARRLQKYVEPVTSYTQGLWKMVSSDEQPVKLNRADYELGFIDPVRKAEETGVINRIKGDYVFINGDKKLLIHLGIHGQHGKGFTSIDSPYPVYIPSPNALGQISVDSIHALNAYQSVELPIGPNVIRKLDLADIKPEIRSYLEEYMTSQMGDWIRNLDDDTTVLATDIPINEAVGWEVLINYMSYPSSTDVVKDLGPLKQSAELMAAAAIATSSGDMIHKLFSGNGGKLTRRDFISLPWKLTKIGMTSVTAAYSLSPIVAFYNANASLFNNINERLADERINYMVKDRQPADYLGRIEALLHTKPSEVSLLEVFHTLRELTGTYKELEVAESGEYLQNGRNEVMAVWGLAHDTKLGFYAVSKNQLLDLIQRFYSHFKPAVEACFANNPANKDWQSQIQRSILWSTTAYHTKLTPAGRKIVSADIWRFPELEKIFNSDVNANHQHQ